jgi:hypothetical protein
MSSLSEFLNITLTRILAIPWQLTVTGCSRLSSFRYFDSQEEKDEWLYDTKKDFTRRKKQSNPESSPEIFTDSSMMEQSITELGHIVDDDDEYVPPGKDNRTCKTMAMMYSNESESEDNCDSHHNSTGLSKLTKPEGFYLLSAQVMWKCSTCNHCQTPFDNTCSFCPPFSAITGSGKLPVSATLDLPHSVATKVQLTTESFPPPSFYESDIAETAVFPEKGEEFLDDLMGMMNENSEVHEPKEALQDVIKHRTRKVKIPDRLIMKV